MPELARALTHQPPDQMMLLAQGTEGMGHGTASLGNWFRERCVEAVLPNCTAHRPRNAGARRLTEHGATEFEIMSFLAHASAREASRYTAAANRSKPADSGMAKSGVDHEQMLSNHSKRLDNKGF